MRHPFDLPTPSCPSCRPRPLNSFSQKLSGRLERLRFDRSQERLEVAEEDREGEEGDDEDADDDVFL